MKKLICLIILFLILRQFLLSQNFVSEKKEQGSFPLLTLSQAASIYVDQNDDWLVHKAASLLQKDIEMVTGRKPHIVSSLSPAVKNIIIIGSISRSSLINQLAKEKKLNIDSLKGKWESFKLQTINLPFKGIENAFVIAGSDKRGTAYGVFELSEQIGVSPWYWWADVPVKKKKEVYIKKGTYRFGPPSVKYRGIFINDEAPAFSGWTKEKFGGVNHLVYEKIFELLLRLKANYLWPAMWGNAFNDDDTLNPMLADQYGIVMGTSHHEPMLRAQQEWKRYGHGKWNYDSNDVVLKDFWKKGIQKMGNHESIVTIGMRGDGDEPMTQGTAIHLLERIVDDQRKIIEEVTGKPASQTPQLWALYKEVQDYYDKGMRVPDDVTLLLCDDNWGNIRRLPALADQSRSGGYGIYYHFDYVGDPRNYKWINTNNIARVWEQMHLAYEYGVKNIWIVNAGDLKPMELPVSFFLDYAWNVKKWDEDNLKNYYTQWAAKQFGSAYAKEIGDILCKYSQYASRRKPELTDADTYSLENFSEWVSVSLQDYNLLAAEAEELNKKLPIEYRDAYYELVLYPVQAFANLNEMYLAVALNKKYYLQNNTMTNYYADRVRMLYYNDSMMALIYNKYIASGKWDHMMDQTHIGYTYWQQPETQKMPDVKYVSKDSAREMIKIDVPIKTSEKFISGNISGNVFFEQNGYVSIEAAHYTKAINTSAIHWQIIPDIGRDGDGITTFPVTANEQTITDKNPNLEYEIYVSDTGTIKLNAYFSPTLNFTNDPEGLKYGISIDDERPQIVSINKDESNKAIWESWVANNIIIKTTSDLIKKPGKHTVKFWMISPAVVLQKIVLYFGEEKQSYLGPPETIFKQYKK